MSLLASGRRVLKSYLLLFIHSSSALSPQHDYDHILERVLNTYVLGEFVGPRWQLGKVMKWTPATQSESLLQDPTSAVQLGRDASRSIGLYKVEGTTVEALVGGVFHQFVSGRFHPGLQPCPVPALGFGKTLTEHLLGRPSCSQALPHATASSSPSAREAGRLAQLLPRRRFENLRANGRTTGRPFWHFKRT